MDYIKRVYKRRVHAEIDSYKDKEEGNKRYKIKAQIVLIRDMKTI